MGKDRDPGGHTDTHQSASTRPLSPVRNPKLQYAKVLLPDGKHKEFDIPKNSDGEILFQKVTADLSIEEREYFSLCFYDKTAGERHWLYNDKKIQRQLKGLPWEFSFEVKFYPTTPSSLVDDHARYYLFLQLRRDILTERLPATSETLNMLGAFVAQIEYGDAPHDMSEDYEKFITSSRLVPDVQAKQENFQNIVAFHRELKGRTTSEAENLYLEHCKHIALYGIHLFPAKDKDNANVNIGIGAAGIFVFKDDVPQHQFNWSNIVKISYRKNVFSVRVKAGVLGKNEATAFYKLKDYAHAKRVWKCAVEHHTFFRLIQPEDKVKGSFFNFGSHRFRYHGRTQFQTKMASQMFDRPSTVERAPSSMSQPIEASRPVLTPLQYTDSELEQRNIEKYRRSLSPKSYTQNPSPSMSFAKYSRPNTLHVTSEASWRSRNRDSQYSEALQYSPRDLDSPQSSGAAYYLSERSSLRTPSSAYYPMSEQSPSSSGIQSPSDAPHTRDTRHGEYNVRMREQKTSARRNLFGKSTSSTNSNVRLVSFHEPVDATVPIPTTHPANELEQLPIDRSVHVYHDGYYDRLPFENRRDLPYGFGVYTPRNGVTRVDRLGPNNEMEEQPIRYFVDVRHSGQSRPNQVKRRSHPGKEDVNEKINPKDYEFPQSSSSTVRRTDLAQEVEPTNIKQYTNIYHSGHSDDMEPSTSQSYRLVARVNPLVVSHRNGREPVTSSNVNAVINQREQTISTRTRRESPDADRRVRLSASVDRSGNLTDTTDNEPSTSYDQGTALKTRRDTPKRKGKGKGKSKIPPSVTTKREVTRTVTRIQHDGKEDVVEKGEIQQTSYVFPVSQKGSSLDETSSRRRVRLIARIRHEGEEDEIDKSDIQHEAYGFATAPYEGPLDETSRAGELDQKPIHDFATVYHHGKSWIKDEPVRAPEPVSDDKKKKAILHVKSPKKEKIAQPAEPETREVRLIARIKPDEHDVDASTVEKAPKSGSSKFGFFKTSSRTSKSSDKSSDKAYPVAAERYTGDVDSTRRNNDLENIPFDHDFKIPAYSPRKHQTSEKTEPEFEDEPRRVRLIARIRHEGEEDEVDKSDIQQEAYGFATALYEGPLDETSRAGELDQKPIHDFATVYHRGKSWIKDEPTSMESILPDSSVMMKRSKSSRSASPEMYENDDEKRPILIARVLPMRSDDDRKVATRTGRKSSKSRILSFLRNSPSRNSYPKGERFDGPMDIIRPCNELEERNFIDNLQPSTSIDHTLYVENSIRYIPSSLPNEPRMARIEGYTADGQGYVEVRIERRSEVLLEPVYVLHDVNSSESSAFISTASAMFGAGPSQLGAISEDESGLCFSSTPVLMPQQERSFLARLGFKRTKKGKSKKSKKENDASETSDSEHDEKREFAVVDFQQTQRTAKPISNTATKMTTKIHREQPNDDSMNEVKAVVTGRGMPPADLGKTTEVRTETKEMKYRLKGSGPSSGFNPDDPSLMATIQRAERQNASSPRLEHAERTFTVRANAPLPVSFEESGQPYTTVSTWQESNDQPEQVEVFTDENGRQVTRTIKSSKVKHTVQTQSFQNYIVDGDQVPVGVVQVERSHEQLTPLNQQEPLSDNGVVDVQTRTMTYEAQKSESPENLNSDLGEYVSSKSVTQGNRTIETITYKTEKDGIIETHVEHRVTIHSDGDIDHDAELSQAILEATQMNPDMVVEKIEVRQEQTQ